MRRLASVFLLVTVLAPAGAGAAHAASPAPPAPATTLAAGPPTTAHAAIFAKTRFFLHAGLAFGAFHHFIWKPYKAKQFTPPRKHKAQIVKAALAALFTVHEVRLALKAAHESKTLSKFVAPLDRLSAQFSRLASQMKRGLLNGGGLAAIEAAVGKLGVKD